MTETMAGLIVPKGDYGFDLNFTVRDSDGDAYNLTGYTIKLKVWSPNNPSILMVNGTCSILVAASGTCKYTVANGDFNSVGNYLFELELTKTGVVESTKTQTLFVTESG